MAENEGLVEGRTKTFDVILAPKTDRKTLLGLKYYSVQMLQQMVDTCCVSYILMNAFARNKELSIKSLTA